MEESHTSNFIKACHYFCKLYRDEDFYPHTYPSQSCKRSIETAVRLNAPIEAWRKALECGDISPAYMRANFAALVHHWNPRKKDNFMITLRDLFGFTPGDFEIAKRHVCLYIGANRIHALRSALTICRMTKQDAQLQCQEVLCGYDSALFCKNSEVISLIKLRKTDAMREMYLAYGSFWKCSFNRSKALLLHTAIWMLAPEGKICCSPPSNKKCIKIVRELCNVLEITADEIIDALTLSCAKIRYWCLYCYHRNSETNGIPHDIAMAAEIYSPRFGTYMCRVLEILLRYIGSNPADALRLFKIISPFQRAISQKLKCAETWNAPRSEVRQNLKRAKS